MKNICVTHHFGCDCREHYLTTLEENFNIAKNALKFYAEKDNWTTIREGFQYIGAIVGDYDLNKVGGSLARQTLKELL
jgi:hypothetical protein